MNPVNQHYIDDFLAHEHLRGYSRSHYVMTRRILEDFAAFLGTNLALASESDVEGYCEMKRPRYAATSYNRICGILSKFFRYLLSVEAILVDPTRRVARLKNDSLCHLGVFTETEVKRLFRVIPSDDFGLRDRALFELLYATGLRIGECLALDVVDVDITTREVSVTESKNRSSRTVPMGDEACHSFDAYLEIRHRFLCPGGEREALFLNDTGHRLNYGCTARAFSRYKTEAGITSPGSLHALRHSCATHLIQHGAPIDMVGRLLGHESITATARYAHLSVDDIRPYLDEEARHESAR